MIAFILYLITDQAFLRARISELETKLDQHTAIQQAIKKKVEQNEVIDADTFYLENPARYAVITDRP